MKMPTLVISAYCWSQMSLAILNIWMWLVSLQYAVGKATSCSKPVGWSLAFIGLSQIRQLLLQQSKEARLFGLGDAAHWVEEYDNDRRVKCHTAAVSLDALRRVPPQIWEVACIWSREAEGYELQQGDHYQSWRAQVVPTILVNCWDVLRCARVYKWLLSVCFWCQGLLCIT